MATTGARESTSTDGYTYAESERGDGWVLFAGFMLLMLGTVNLIQGIAAVSNSKFYVANAQFVVSDLNTLGWVLIVLGSVQLLASFGIWARTKGVRWFGIAVASLNAIAQLVFMSSYPFWSLTMFTLDILVIYGLAAYGAKRLD